MQIHRIRGRNLTDALRRARAAHGDGAVVLSQETVPGGVTISVTEPPSKPTRGAGRLLGARKPADRGQTDVLTRLQRHGASARLIEHVSKAVSSSGVHGMYTVDVAARVLGRAFAVPPSPRRDGRTHVIAFVGPTGAGKTTTLSKLARRLGEAGRKPLIASLDPVGIASLEAACHVTADADRAELAIRAVRGADDLGAAVAPGGLALLDTPGISPRDASSLEELGGELDTMRSIAAVDSYLVLPATSSRESLELVTRAFDVLSPTGVVITKLDETERPTPVLEHCLRSKLPVAFLCNGQDVRTHLHRARGDHFADLMLRGRITR